MTFWNMDSLYSPNYNLCDDILKCLSADITFPDVDLKPRLVEPENQILEVLDILERNGHIKRFHLNSPLTVRGTQKGMDFYNDGGYKSQLQRDKLQKQYLIDLNKSVLDTNSSVRKTNLWMPILTGALVLVALVGFIKETVKDKRQLKSTPQLQMQKSMSDILQQIRQTFQIEIHRLEDSLKNISKPNNPQVFRSQKKN